MINQTVHLLQEHELWSEVEVVEEYQLECMYCQHEIFYTFTLPSSSVVTGLWVWTTEWKQAHVEPRGTAQTVYPIIGEVSESLEILRRSTVIFVKPKQACFGFTKITVIYVKFQCVFLLLFIVYRYHESKRTKSSPTMLEEIGSGQYRLRFFPDTDYPPKLKFTYKTMQSNGTACWSLPKLTEKRNVYPTIFLSATHRLRFIYWDYATTQFIHNSAKELSLWRLDSDWLGHCLPRRSSTSVPQSLSFHFEDQHTSIVAKVMPDVNSIDKANRISGRTIAVILDRSYSMNAVKEKTENSLQYLQRCIHDITTTMSLHQLRYFQAK